MLAIANKPEEHRPCASIIVNAPSHPQLVLVSSPAASRPICPTEEYAINDLRSVCRIQIILVITAPHIARLIKIVEIAGQV